MKPKFLYILSAFLVFSSPIFSQVTVTSSNLPLVVIDTKGQTIVDGTKIDALMKVISNSSNINKPTDPGNNYNGHVGIEYRGGKPKTGEQNPFNFETRDASGGNNNVSLLGLPAENDWILLANYNDKSLIRNALSFEIFRKMAHYSPHVKMVEVLINNEYQGIYFLAEKIKQDKGRVDISNLTSTDISGDNLTGGYIFKIDEFTTTNSWLSSYTPIDHPEKQVHFVYEDPDPSKLVTQQKDYLKNTVTSFEKVLYSSTFKDPTTGYQAWIKINSWLDFFLVSEVSRNINAYKKNCFYFKDKDSKDKKIHSGPVWDFDSGYKNLDATCTPFRAIDGSGWTYKINDCTDNKTNSNGWIVRLLQDPAFASSVNARYALMRNSFLSNTYINNFIDSVANLASPAQVRHYTKWNILSASVGDPEVDAQPDTYSGHVAKLKSWIQTRLNWLDIHIPGEITSVSEPITESGFSIRIFPNPTSNLVYIEASSKILDIQLVNTSGQTLMHSTGKSAYATQLDVSRLSKGIYMVLVKMDGQQQQSSKLVIE
jgi:hypothetical protein